MIIDQELKDKILPELRAGEKLIWADKPQKFPMNYIGLIYIVFAIVWAIIVVTIIRPLFSNAGALDVDMVIPVFSYFSVFFFLLGLLLLIIPTRETYAVTDQRGLIFWRFPMRRVASLSPETLTNLSRTGKEEIGTLNAESGPPRTPMQMAFKKSFKNISNPKQVEDLIYKTFQKGSS